jgi:hypothetical protein
VEKDRLMLTTTPATPIKAAPLDDEQMEAWFQGRIPRRLLAIPFGGPFKSPHSPRGVDLDGEWFSERTDIKPDWLDFRVLDWHHGKDPLMGRTTLGKAVLEDEPDEEGWWVNVWLAHGERRLNLVKALVARGGQLFGSAETIQEMAFKKADTGELLQWPYWRQTFSTSPQNTQSVLRPAKAALDDALSDYTPRPAFWADFADELRTLGSSLREPSGMGASGAKAGRVLSSANEADIDEALAALQEADRLVAAAEKLRSVLARHRKESTQ